MVHILRFFHIFPRNSDFTVTVGDGEIFSFQLLSKVALALAKFWLQQQPELFDTKFWLVRWKKNHKLIHVWSFVSFNILASMHI